VVDLSVGTPVDPTPQVIQDALAGAANAPGYPTTLGTPDVRRSCSGWMSRRLGVECGTDAVLPSIGSKEMVAWLPTLLGLGPQSHVVLPRVAYPTYAVGAALAGARATATDEPEQVDDVQFIWLNSPGNPTGRVLSPQRMAEIVTYARGIGAIVVSDECYIELGWEASPISVLHPAVSGGDHRGLIAVHSLSKRSNLAGYRFGFVAGDRDLLGEVLEVRKHAGMMTPAPVQAAAVAAFDDDEHVEQQRERYRRRRDILRAGLVDAGFTIDHSEAGLYLWTTRGEPCWDTVSWFADRGIVVTPGDFYGLAGAHHVRIALTASDADIASAAERVVRSGSHQ
jgi:succinyldiaminopimelate transaminase